MKPTPKDWKSLTTPRLRQILAERETATEEVEAASEEPFKKFLELKKTAEANCLAGMVASLFVRKSNVSASWDNPKLGFDRLFSEEEVAEKLQSSNVDAATRKALQNLGMRSWNIFFDSSLASEKSAVILRNLDGSIHVDITTNLASFIDIQTSTNLPVHINVVGGSNAVDDDSRLYINPLNPQHCIKCFTLGGEAKFDLSVVKLSALNPKSLSAYVSNQNESELLRLATSNQYSNLVVYCVDRESISTYSSFGCFLGDLSANTLVITQSSRVRDESHVAIEMLREAGIAVIEAPFAPRKEVKRGVAASGSEFGHGFY